MSNSCYRAAACEIHSTLEGAEEVNRKEAHPGAGPVKGIVNCFPGGLWQLEGPLSR